MNIIAAYFEERPEYKDLKKIFINTVSATMPEAEIDIVEIPRINRESLDHHQDTYIGFKIAAEKALRLDQDCAICDIDLMFRKSIAPVWEHDFDIAVTTREHPARYNTGIWFMRNTENAKFFVKQWFDLTERFANDFDNIQPGIKKWAGIDQYSLACMIQNNKKAKVIELPCSEWNAEQTCWSSVDDNTKVIHLKSQLRNELFNRPQNLKYDGVLSKRIKTIPACVELAREARGWL